jgi:hypothetical protein
MLRANSVRWIGKVDPAPDLGPIASVRADFKFCSAEIFTVISAYFSDSGRRARARATAAINSPMSSPFATTGPTAAARSK